MAADTAPGWAGRCLGAALLIAASTVISWGEDVTMTGFYPAPRGIYETLQTVGNADLANSAAAIVDIGVQPVPAYPWAPVPGKVNVNGSVQALDYVGLGPLPPAPSGMVMIFQGACPVNWAPVGGGWNGRVIRGGPGFGATGGAPNHTHRQDHNHFLPPQIAAPSTLDGDHQHFGMDVSHPHVFGGRSQGGGNPRCCDQGCGMFEQCRQAARRNHTHDFGQNTDAIIMQIDSDLGGVHQHAFNVTWNSAVEQATTDVVNNWPNYIEVVFCAAP